MKNPVDGVFISMIRMIICTLIGGIVVLSGYNVRLKGKMTVKSVLLLVFCGAMNGFADLSQKMFVKLNENASAAVFNFYSYLFSFIILSVVFAFISKKQTSKRKDIGKITGYILIMGICLFFNSYFKTLAAHNIDAARLYPLCQGLSLIFSSLMATFLLKEKLDFKGAIGIVIAFGALLIINLL